MRNLTPVSELPQTLDEGGRLAWQYPISTYVDQERIGLHVPRTERAIKMAGFAGVVVKAYMGEQTEYQMNNVQATSVNFDGSITGSADVTTTKAALHQNAINYPQNGLVPICKWPTATVELNRNELASRVADKIHAGANQEKAWATELDHALRRGITAAAKDKLLKEIIRYKDEAFVNAAILCFVGGQVVAEGVANGLFIGPAFTYGVVQAGTTFVAAMVNKQNTGHHHMDKRRWSLFLLRQQPDRLALAAAMLASRRVVGYKK